MGQWLATDMHPFNRATTSAGPREEGLLAIQACVGVNAHIATREVWRGDECHLHYVKHDPEASSRLCSASRFQVRLQLATCDLALHVPRFESTSAGDSQLTSSSVPGSFMNLLTVLVRILTPTDW